MSHKDLVGNGLAIISLPIEGMACASCVRRVEAELQKITGVRSVAVNLATERTEVRPSGGGAVNRAPLVRAVEAAGYDVPAQTIKLSIDGMTCASCVGRVERSLEAEPGGVQATVNLATERATVRGIAAADALVAAIDKAGYKAQIVAALARPDDDNTAARKDAERLATQAVVDKVTMWFVPAVMAAFRALREACELLGKLVAI